MSDLNSTDRSSKSSPGGNLPGIDSFVKQNVTPSVISHALQGEIPRENRAMAISLLVNLILEAKDTKNIDPDKLKELFEIADFAEMEAATFSTQITTAGINTFRKALKTLMDQDRDSRSKKESVREKLGVALRKITPLLDTREAHPMVALAKNLVKDGVTNPEIIDPIRTRSGITNLLESAGFVTINKQNERSFFDNSDEPTLNSIRQLVAVHNSQDSRKYHSALRNAVQEILAVDSIRSRLSHIAIGKEGDKDLALKIEASLLPGGRDTPRISPPSTVEEILSTLSALRESDQALENAQKLSPYMSQRIALENLLLKVNSSLKFQEKKLECQETIGHLNSDPLLFIKKGRNYYDYLRDPILTAFGFLDSEDKSRVILSIVNELNSFSKANILRSGWRGYLEKFLVDLLRVDARSVVISTTSMHSKASKEMFTTSNDCFCRCLLAMSSTGRRSDEMICNLIISLPIRNNRLIAQLREYVAQYPTEGKAIAALSTLKHKNTIEPLLMAADHVEDAEKELDS